MKMAEFFDIVVSLKYTDVIEVRTPSIIRPIKMVAVVTSQTSVSFHGTTLRDIPEDSRLYTCRHDNLKFHKLNITFLKSSYL